MKNFKPIRITNDFLGWNYVDEMGNFLFKRNFAFARAFKEGYGAVQLDIAEWNFVKENGRIAFPKARFAFVNDFNFSRAAVCFDDGKWNYITKDGKPLTRKGFRRCYDFIGKVAPVEVSRGERRIRLITRDGEMIKRKCFVSISATMEGRLVAETKPNLYAMLDGNGDFLTEKPFKWIDSFKHSVARVQDEKGKWNYIDIKGKLLFDEGFDDASSFDSRGVAIARKGKRFVVISRDGKQLFDKTFSDRHYAKVAINEFFYGGAEDDESKNE